MYDFDSNYIQAMPIKSRKSSELTQAFATCYKTLTTHGFSAREIRLDNEISEEFKEYISGANLKYQLASPGDHRTMYEHSCGSTTAAGARLATG